MAGFTFEVPFVASKQRPRFAGHAYKSKRDRENMEQIALAWAQLHAPMVPKGVPIRVLIFVYKPLPKTTPKKVESEPNVVKPDADNVAKLILDALNGVAWYDDAQICRLEVEKLPRERKPDHAYMKVTILTGEPSDGHQ